MSQGYPSRIDGPPCGGNSGTDLGGSIDGHGGWGGSGGNVETNNGTHDFPGGRCRWSGENR
jgi:hypothetical protein